MAPVRPRRAAARAPALAFLGTLGMLLLLALVLPHGMAAGNGGATSGPAQPNFAPTAADRSSAAGPAVSIAEVGVLPSEVAAGTPTTFAWQALDAQGARVSSFAATAELTLTESTNGSAAPAWVNCSATAAPLGRSPNGSFAVVPADWSGGVLNLSVEVATAATVWVNLSGPLLPSVPPAVLLNALPDLDHLVLYGATMVANHLANASRSYAAFWLVHDRFGDPAPGADLVVQYAVGTSAIAKLVPVLWSTNGTTGAWVNVTVPGQAAASVTVLDASGTVLLGPLSVPAVSASAPANAPTLSPLALVAVALLAVGGVGGIGALWVGGRPRPAPEPTGEEEDLRRLAEGRATVVEILRAKGPLTLRDLEAAWSPPPAPPALADWLASLVTDGTLSASVGDGGAARFALVERATEPPRVTLDEAALDREMARRDAAVGPDPDDEDAR